MNLRFYYGLLPKHTKFGKDFPTSSWEEDVNGPGMMDNDGMPRGPLSDSGGLKWKRDSI